MHKSLSVFPSCPKIDNKERKKCPLKTDSKYLYFVNLIKKKKKKQKREQTRKRNTKNICVIYGINNSINKTNLA